MSQHDEHQAELADEYVSALQHDINAEPPADLDPDMAAFLRRLTAKYPKLQPSPHIQIRAWHQFARRIAVSAQATVSTSPNGTYHPPTIIESKEPTMVAKASTLGHSHQNTTYLLPIIAAMLTIVLLGIVIFALINSSDTSSSGSASVLQSSPTPTATEPALFTNNLDDEANVWDVYTEGVQEPTGILQNVETPSIDGNALQCSLSAAGAPYLNFACYRNLPLNAMPNDFELNLQFMFSPATTCRNLGGNSIIQAIEFSISTWQNASEAGTRYRSELALQMEIVEYGLWRYWDGESWQTIEPEIDACLEADQWHELSLSGQLILLPDQEPELRYQAFTLDGETYNLDIDVPVVWQDPGESLAAFLVQLDGNGNENGSIAYDVYVDQVHFERRITPLAIVDANELNVRSNPSLCDDILTTIGQGDVVTLIGQLANGTWYQVIADDGITGWVYADLLTLTEGIDLSTLPILPDNSRPCSTNTTDDTPITMPTPDGDCSTARLNRPSASEPHSVSRTFSITWTPGAGCPMVVQIYQNGQLVAELQDTASGSVNLSNTAIQAGIDTEVKIWAPGSSAPIDSMFVRVQSNEECSMARLDRPSGSVPRTFSITWTPAVGCPMDVQIYQRGEPTPRIHVPNTSSGSVNLSNPALEAGVDTEIKVWIPGSSTPRDSMWVTIQ